MNKFELFEHLDSLTEKLMKNLITVSLLFLLIMTCQQTPSADETLQVDPILFGDIKPKGWLKSQMLMDVTEGFVGQLDRLVPELIVEDNIYGKDRMTKLVKSKDVGAITDDNGDWQVQFLWWNSETQSNWWDGFIRHAILTQDLVAMQKVKTYVEEKLATQDDDGYIGVYASDLRYNHSTENGELWAQSSLFRGLLAFYEFSKEERILTAVEKAVALTMKRYPINESQPFKVEKPYAGVGHGLTFVDVLDRLYELTEKTKYMEYALFLYQDYNKHDLSEVDIQTKNLLDTAYRFKGHGVHTYEHLRALVLANEQSDNPIYTQALTAYQERLETVLTPSGAPIGDEWIFERTAHPDQTGYEYCSLHELLDSYSLLLAKTGEPKWADKMEWLLFNAAQGARHPNGKSIAYCKTDNSYFMQGALEKKNIGKDNHSRFKYSPVHKEVAVCCAPNASRIYPYYVKSMWDSTEKGLQLNLFGASTLSSMIDGQAIRVDQETAYPHDLTIQLKLSMQEPITFQLAVRKPDWATGYTINSDAILSESTGLIKLTKKWKDGDLVELKFEAKPIVRKHLSNEQFISHGPLIYGRPIEGEEKVIKDYNIGEFKDLSYSSDESIISKWTIVEGAPLKQERNPAANLWRQNKIITTLVDDSGQKQSIELFPMGGLILRQVTFE